MNPPELLLHQESMSVQYIPPSIFGFAGVYLFVLIFASNIDCGYSLEPPRRRGGSNVYPQSMF